jgi:uncharacterized protein YgiM (DUF1202 family)
MGKTLTTLTLAAFFIFSTAATSGAWSRHYGPSYRNHYQRSHFHSRPLVNHHYGYKSHYRYSNRYDDHYWTYLGAGLLTGAALTSLAYRPARERTVIYTTAPPVYTAPPPVIIQQEQVTVRRQYAPPAVQSELILRRVETTAQLLNVRSGPGVGEMVTSQVQRGDILDVLGAAPDWLYVRTESGFYGWVMAQYTREAEGPVG